MSTFRWYMKSTSDTRTQSMDYQANPIDNLSWVAGYEDNGGTLPSPGRSIAVNVSSGNGFIYVLGEDNVVHQSFGNRNVTAPNGTDFAHWSVYLQPIDTSGATLSLTKIVSLRLPSNYGQGIMLLALDTSGRIFVETVVGSTRRWMPAAQFPGFAAGTPGTTSGNGLPTGVSWSDISRGATGGAYLLTTAGDIYRGATGGTLSNGNASWSQVQKLPSIMFGSTRIFPAKVGGPYALAKVGNGTCTPSTGYDQDDIRFWAYSSTDNTWHLHNQGVDANHCSATSTVGYYDIWDSGSGFDVETVDTHINSWHN